MPIKTPDSQVHARQIEVGRRMPCVAYVACSHTSLWSLYYDTGVTFLSLILMFKKAIIV